MIIRSSKEFSGSGRRRFASGLGAAVLALVLAGCAGLLPDSYARDIPAALEAADVGVVDVEVRTSRDGLAKRVTVWCTFDSETRTLDELARTLGAVSDGFGGQKAPKLMIGFFGPEGEDPEGLTAAVAALNAELGRTGDDAVVGENGRIYFSSVGDLHDLVRGLGSASS